jgi:hypothetical protein
LRRSLLGVHANRKKSVFPRPMMLARRMLFILVRMSDHRPRLSEVTEPTTRRLDARHLLAQAVAPDLVPPHDSTDPIIPIDFVEHRVSTLRIVAQRRPILEPEEPSPASGPRAITGSSSSPSFVETEEEDARPSVDALAPARRTKRLLLGFVLVQAAIVAGLVVIVALPRLEEPGAPMTPVATSVITPKTTHADEGAPRVSVPTTSIPKEVAPAVKAMPSARSTRPATRVVVAPSTTTATPAPTKDDSDLEEARAMARRARAEIDQRLE